MKKILFVISTLTGGGAERVVSNLTLEMCKYVDIDILVNSVSEQDYPVEGNIISLGMKPRRYKNIWYQLRAFYKRFITLRKLKRRNNYCACISILDSANIANILTGKKYCDIILTEHNTLSECNTLEFKLLIDPLIKILYNRANKIVCVSKGVEQDLIDNFNIDFTKTCTIYNGFVEKTDMDTNIRAKKYKVVTIGRLEYQKGHIHLIRAFSEVVSKYPEAMLYIIGEGSLRSELKRLVYKLGLDANVIFCGFSADPNVLLKDADIFVLSSVFEGFGNVLIEAMQLGVPVVSTDYPYGAREILTADINLTTSLTGNDNYEIAQYGILTPVCSGSRDFESITIQTEEHILANAIQLLFKDRNLRNNLALQGMKRAQDFAIAHIVDQWRELLDL